MTSSVVGWSARKFRALTRLSPNVSVEDYDKQFYPGPGRARGWRLHPDPAHPDAHDLAPRARHPAAPRPARGHGDRRHLLRHRRFRGARSPRSSSRPGCVAIDHAKPSLAYARKVASDFGVKGIEYVYGDAASLLLEDNQFDFVTCRHSLQIFNKPELILKELYRICKPGGRVYVTNEKNSHCLGEPRAESHPVDL